MNFGPGNFIKSSSFNLRSQIISASKKSTLWQSSPGNVILNDWRQNRITNPSVCSIGQSDQNNSATVSKLRSQPATTGYILINPSWLPWCCVAYHNSDLSCKTSDQIGLFDHYRDTRAAILDPCIQGIFNMHFGTFCEPFLS